MVTALYDNISLGAATCFEFVADEPRGHSYPGAARQHFMQRRVINIIQNVHGHDPEISDGLVQVNSSAILIGLSGPIKIGLAA